MPLLLLSLLRSRLSMLGDLVCVCVRVHVCIHSRLSVIYNTKNPIVARANMDNFITS